MGELKRKDDQLTTADLARGAEQPSRPDIEDPARPKPVRSENTERWNQESTGPQPVRNAGTQTAETPLFSDSDIGDLRNRWGNVQTSFVDEPRKAVEEADNLVANVMKRLAESFANERSSLEKQWDRGDNVSTEDLRVAFQRYRTFFDRLLNV